MNVNNSFLYVLEEEGEIINQTHASSVEKALDYFKSIGYDLYENSDLSIRPVSKSYKDAIADLRNSDEDSVDAWDKWHPQY